MEQSRKIKLLELEEERVQAMAALEQKQRQTKAFVDRHRRQTEKQFAIGKTGIGISNQNGVDAGEITILIDRAILDNRQQEWYVLGRYTSRGKSTKMD